MKRDKKELEQVNGKREKHYCFSLSLYENIQKSWKGRETLFLFQNFQHICYEAPLSLVGCCTLDCNVEPPTY